MLGNNPAPSLRPTPGQLDKRLNTVSGVLVWMPTTGVSLVRQIGFADMTIMSPMITVWRTLHLECSTRTSGLAAQRTMSENTRSRLSDGSTRPYARPLWTALSVSDARYQMGSRRGAGIIDPRRGSTIVVDTLVAGRNGWPHLRDPAALLGDVDGSQRLADLRRTREILDEGRRSTLATSPSSTFSPFPSRGVR